MNTTETVSNDVVVEDTSASNSSTEDTSTAVSSTTSVEDTTSAAVASASTSAASNAPATVAGAKRPGRPRKIDSGLNICRGLYEKNPNAPRAELVKQFIAAGVATDTANTYYHVVHNAATGKTKAKAKAVASSSAPTT